MTVEIEHNDGCKVWLNRKLVYENKGDRRANLIFDERSIEMSHSFPILLRKGRTPC